MAELKRTLGLFECTVMGVGAILGAGIYALVGKAAALAGNAVWISFGIAAVVAGLSGLSYAELASFIPRVGGQYHYAQRAFGRLVAFLLGWLLVCGLSIAGAAVGLGFGGYLAALTGVPTSLGALGLLVGCAALLSWGIREAAWFATVCAALEVLGLIAVIAVGTPSIGQADLLATGPTGVAGVGAAATLVFFAYIGFEEIVQLAEETHDPTKTVPRALLLSIIITTVLYVWVALAAVSVVGAARLGLSEAPLAEVFSGFSQATVAISVIALFSTANTVLVLVMSASRLMVGMARDRRLPPALAHVGAWRGTPWVATWTVAALAGLIVLGVKAIDQAANITNLALLLAFLLINASVIALRFREPDAPRPFRLRPSVAGVPLVPVLAMISVLALATQVGASAWGWGAGVMAVGAVVWVVQRPKEVVRV
jgi:basic amino acid/polyamine antiporter, APA family